MKRAPTLRAALLAGMLLLMVQATGTPAGASSEPPPGTVTLTGSITNPFFQEMAARGGTIATVQTLAISDPSNHLILMFNKAAPNYARCSTQAVASTLVVMDSDTYSVLTPRPTNGVYCAPFPQPDVPVVAPILVVDPVDRLIIDTGLDEQSLNVYDERTLVKKATWAMPLVPNPTSGPDTYIVGLSWSAIDDSVIVLTDNVGFSQGHGLGPPGAAVTSVGVPQSLRAGSLKQLWSASVSPPCIYTVTPSYGTSAAFQSQRKDAVYVPCVIAVDNGGETAGIVKLETAAPTSASSSCSSSAKLCPDGKFSVAESPGPTSDLLFDPGLDRAFSPVNGSSVDLLIYDGSSGSFGGSVRFGSHPDTNNNAIGLDTVAGRLYTVAPTTGLTLLDARRTPIPAGTRFTQYGIAELINLLAVLPPDNAYPYTRLLINDDLAYRGQGQNNGQPDFLVAADRVPVTQDPPNTSVDSNTHVGAIPKGQDVAATYGASARGYGFHTDNVGGGAGVLQDVSSNGVNADTRLATGNDLLGADVGQLSLRNGRPQGEASALADGNGQSAYVYALCSSTSADLGPTEACLGRPDCGVETIQQSIGCQPLPGNPVAPSPAPAGGTSQQWLYPDEICPTANGTATSSATGITFTGSDGSTAPVPGSDGSASASASCAPTGPSAAASLQGTGAGAGALGIDIGGGSTSSAITPASASKHLSATVTATSRGIEVYTIAPSGVRTPILSIDSVVQQATTSAAGTAGTATASDSLVISNVNVAGSSVCGSQCDVSSVLSSINNALAGFMHAEVPEPDSRYLNDCSGQREGGTLTCHGSPGGYLAVIQANLTEQLGDQKFNQMSEQEATFLPGLRLVLYGAGDGQPTRDREVVDLAGVEVDSEYGLTAIPPPSSLDFSNVPLQQAEVAAGTFTSYTVAGMPAKGGTANDLTTIIKRIVRSVLSGIAWLARHPLEAIQMFAFLSLLALPVVMTRRRWTWVQERVAT